MKFKFTAKQLSIIASACFYWDPEDDEAEATSTEFAVRQELASGLNTLFSKAREAVEAGKTVELVVSD